ncbi:HD domain-containing protein [Streptacidiphilus rugosus]|uniref:HD domain-containing protein n=1 Tax=Streptacidiphilus rugosus TaxID=405783 RepID=UPI001E354406|nr:HD domain-containing protein [Streptacidiphilus rugosus]
MTEEYPSVRMSGAQGAPRPSAFPRARLTSPAVLSGAHTDHAFDLARCLLAREFPQRWEHSQGAAAGASRLAPILGKHSEVVRAAALLHDIGYASTVSRTGFHPLDGARYLRGLGVDQRVVSLVAHHTFALLEAELRELREPLEGEFELPPQELQDAMVYCDMTSALNGQLTTSRVRTAEILIRYGTESIVGRFITRAEPLIHAAVARVVDRLDRAGESV